MNDLLSLLSPANKGSVMAEQYLKSIIQERSATFIQKLLLGTKFQNVSGDLQRWGGKHVVKIMKSGSYAKGTAISSSSDLDLVLIFSSHLSSTMQDIYDQTHNYLKKVYGPVRVQNVSLRIKVDGGTVDVVPAKLRKPLSNYLTIRINKTNSWQQTNINQHLDFVKKSGRLDEIKAFKIWNNQKGLEMSSFLVELFVIRALKGKLGNLNRNISTVLSWLVENLLTCRLEDPANTANDVSDELTISQRSNIVNSAYKSLTSQTWKDFIV